MRVLTALSLILLALPAVAHESFEAEWCNKAVKMYTPDEQTFKTGEVCYGNSLIQGDISVRTIKIVEDGAISFLYHGHGYGFTRVASETIIYKYVSEILNSNSRATDVALTWSATGGGGKEVFGSTPKGFQFLATKP